MERRAFVVDELALVRAGIGAVLRDLDIEVVRSTRAAREAVADARLERPGLVVIGAPADLALDDAARRTAALRPRPAVVALVPPGQEHVAAYLVALRVEAVLRRAATPEELAAAVLAVEAGEQHVAPSLTGPLTGRLRPLAEVDDDILTGREREVLTFLAEGRSNRDIADALSVTLATVKSHLVRIYAKLGVRNRNEALSRAVARGLLG